MPKPGFELTASLLEQFTELENVVGVKWSSHEPMHYFRILRQFADRFNFIDNMQIFFLGSRLEMKGFISHFANVAPRLDLMRWNLLQNRQYEEYDKLFLKMHFDPYVTMVTPEQASWVGMGEGPTARLSLRLLGMDSGPPFPAQAPLSESYIEDARRAVEASGMLAWVDWDQSIVES